MNEHRLEKAKELWREYERWCKEYEKEQELEQEEITYLYNLNEGESNVIEQPNN